MWKRPRSSCCLALLLTVVNKDSFENSEAGLFTSSNANEAGVRAVPFGKTLWSRDASYFGLSVGLEEANRVASPFLTRQPALAWLKLPAVRLLSAYWLCSVAVAFSGALFPVSHFFTGAVWKTALNVRESARGSASTVREPKLADQNFLTCQKFMWLSDGLSGADNWPSLPPPHCTDTGEHWNGNSAQLQTELRCCNIGTKMGLNCTVCAQLNLNIIRPSCHGDCWLFVTSASSTVYYSHVMLCCWYHHIYS